jgi:hypothetical protein
MMPNVQLNDFFVQKNFLVNLEIIENTGFTTDKFLNNFIVQNNSNNFFVQRNFWKSQNQWFKKILELICIYKYIQIIFLYIFSKNTIIGGKQNDSWKA